MSYTKIKSGINKDKYQNGDGNVFTADEIADKSVADILRPNKEIKTKTRIGFGDGIYRTKENIDKIKENKLKEL